MKYKIDTNTFLDWFINDKEDLIDLGVQTEEQLKETGLSTITAEDLLHQCGYIPKRLLEDTSECRDDEEVTPDDVELI